MEGRARMGWRGNRGCPQRLPATRRLTAGSTRVAGRALPWRVRGCPDPGAGRVPGRFGAPAPNLPAGLLEGFTPEPRPDERLALNSNGRLLLLRLADISWLEATDHGAVLHVGTEAHLIRDTLAALSVKLPPGRFVRISPVALVN